MIAIFLRQSPTPSRITIGVIPNTQKIILYKDPAKSWGH
jgi:hypothetical protein